MKEYINELIITVAACRLVTMASPDGDLRRRYLAAVCALVTLITLFSPMGQVIAGAEEAIRAFAGGFSLAENDEKQDELERAAAVIFSYAENRRGFDTKGGNITFYTDESGEIESIAVFFEDGSVEMCRLLQEDLTEEIGIEVHVFTGEVNED